MPRKKPARQPIPTWFKVSAVVLVALIGLNNPGLQIFVEASFDGVPFVRS